MGVFMKVGLVGLAGADEAFTLATQWAYGEDKEVLQRIGELCLRFDEAAEKLLQVNDVVDARLVWIDSLAQVLVREKTKWKKDVQKAASGTSASVGRLAGTNDDMIGALSRLEAGIGSFLDGTRKKIFLKIVSF
jgi:hypothetical protein